LAHEGGKGRNAGRLGALRCRLRSGKSFKVGSGFTDRERWAAQRRAARVCGGQLARRIGQEELCSQHLLDRECDLCVLAGHIL